MSDKPLDIYLIGICGTGMGALAGMLKRLGHHVRGADASVYPPMSEKLREWGIEPLEGYDPTHLDRAPDLVVVGNVIRRDNPEAVAARERGLASVSMPEAIARFGIRDKHSVVIAGTHGKTTTTALAAHVLVATGRDPSFLVGGALVGYTDSFRVGGGDFFVIEGDEYDTAYFDKGPKFLHYRPRTAVITSVEFDHADIFPSIEAVDGAFRGLIERVPSDGHIVVWAGATRARRLIAESARGARVTVYATEFQADADLYLRSFASGPDGLRIEPVLEGKSLGPMRVPLWGVHSAANTLAVIGALRDAHLDASELGEALASFRGVRRRMEVRGELGGVALIDDFAHHPTAVRETVAAARTRWPGRRVWAVFEPRSATTRRNILQDDLAVALAHADCAIIASHARLAEVPEAQRFDPPAVARTICERGRRGFFEPQVDGIVECLARETRPGDVVLILSNGDFGGLHKKLLARLNLGAQDAS